MPGINSSNKQEIENVNSNLVEETLIRDRQYVDGLPTIPAEPSKAPSRPVNKINVPEVKNSKATFVYNYFTRDERSRDESPDDLNRVIILDASNNEEIFHRSKNKKLARYVKLEFSPPQVPSDLIETIDPNNNLGIDLSEQLNKIIVEGTMTNQIFTGVELLDTGREQNIYNMLNSALFFTELKNSRQSNKEKIQSLYNILEEKGGLEGADKKILLESFRNIPPVNTSQGGYVLAESDVSPEIAKTSNDPIGKQTFSVQMNNLMMSDLLNKATKIPDSVFQDELRAMIPVSRDIRSSVVATIDPDKFSAEADYALVLNDVISETPIENYNENDYPIIKFAGYLIEKYEVLPDENVIFRGRKYIVNHNSNYSIDAEVRYGGSYFYRIRTVVKVKTVITSEYTTNPSLNTKSIAEFYIASEGVNTSVHCIETQAPPPPTNLHVKFNFETLKPRITWQFPLNKQRDIKRFQIFKRLTVNEPFRLLAEYDFDNSIIKSPVAEVAPSDRVYKFGQPRTFYTDISHDEGQKPIYAVACVDAHGLTSNYSAQIMVERNRYTNQVKRTIISREGAPKPYPNLFLNEDTFQDCIKVSGYDRIKLVFNPEYFKVLKTIDHGSAGGGFVEERDLKLLAFDLKDPKYKFHFINVDNQKDQVVNVKLDINASPAGANEGMFETSTANFNASNFSFQYGVE
mgnify:CR=1 FL=1